MTEKTISPEKTADALLLGKKPKELINYGVNLYPWSEEWLQELATT